MTYGSTLTHRALGNLEYAVLRVLIAHHNDAYGTAIKKWVEITTGRNYSDGAVYTSLERLEKKRYVRSEWGGITATRGGRRKRFYWIEDLGRQAVRDTQILYADQPVFGQMEEYSL